VKTFFQVALKTTVASMLVLSLAGQVGAQSPSDKQQEWQVNFKDSDIQEVIKFVADVTGKTVIIDPRVKGFIST